MEIRYYFVVKPNFIFVSHIKNEIHLVGLNQNHLRDKEDLGVWHVKYKKNQKS